MKRWQKQLLRILSVVDTEEVLQIVNTFKKGHEQDMPLTSEMIKSTYLKSVDIPSPVIVTVASVKSVNIAKEDEEPNYKWVMKFEEFERGLILNGTNIKIAEKVFASGNTDRWIGREIVLYTDPTVQYAGQMVGGLRLRGQEKAPVKAGKARIAEPEIEDEIVPF